MTDQERYAAAAHAMQSGVAMTLNRDAATGSIKHLRVGINCALRDVGTLSSILVAKGIVTEEELWKALADGMEAEARQYEKELSEQLGTVVKLL